MGQIQNSVNQAIGTVGTVSAVAKQVAGQQESLDIQKAQKNLEDVRLAQDITMESADLIEEASKARDEYADIGKYTHISAVARGELQETLKDRDYYESIEGTKTFKSMQESAEADRRLREELAANINTKTRLRARIKYVNALRDVYKARTGENVKGEVAIRGDEQLTRYIKQSGKAAIEEIDELRNSGLEQGREIGTYKRRNYELTGGLDDGE